MLKNAHLIAKIGAGTAENERNFTKNLQKKLATTLPTRGVVAQDPRDDLLIHAGQARDARRVEPPHHNPYDRKVSVRKYTQHRLKYNSGSSQPNILHFKNTQPDEKASHILGANSSRAKSSRASWSFSFATRAESGESTKEAGRDASCASPPRRAVK